MVSEGSHFGRRSVLCLGLGLVLAAVLPAATGCGDSPPSASDSTGRWAAPAPAVLAAFDEAAVTLGRSVYVPAELPEGTQLAPEGQAPMVLEAVSVESVVSLAVGQGRLDVLQGVQGDLGDVQGIPCGSVAGRPAKVFEVSGGHLVQWEDEGEWYAVFGLDMPSESVIRVALSMKRGR